MIIAFSGERRAGKDTAVKYLEQYEFRHLKFAFPIRRALEIRFQLPYQWQWDRDKTMPQRLLNGMSKRQAMQRYGTEGFGPEIEWLDDGYTVVELASYLHGLYGKPIKSVEEFLTCCDRGGFRDKIDPDFWAECLIPKDVPHDAKIGVSDLRFPNEWKIIKNHGGFHVHIIGNPVEESTAHASESHQNWLKSHADYIIDNRDRSESFFEEIDSIVDDIAKVRDSWIVPPVKEETKT